MTGRSEWIGKRAGVPAHKSFGLIAEDLECYGLGLQAVLAEDFHCPHKGGPAGLVVMEQVSAKEHKIDLRTKPSTTSIEARHGQASPSVYAWHGMAWQEKGLVQSRSHPSSG